MISLFDLVIFDCDGVLVDSEIIANGVMAECLNEAGVMLTVEQTMAFGVGKSATAVAAAVKMEFGVTLPANFFEDMGTRIIAAYPGKLRPMDGIPELLTALELRCCVASNSPIDRVRHALATTGLMPHLEPHLYSAAMVERGKPAPDLFLFAAKQQGVRPERCLVIEDSLSGTVSPPPASEHVTGICRHDSLAGLTETHRVRTPIDPAMPGALRTTEGLGYRMAHPTILLVRHGETEWNRVSRYQGWSDSPLTERGVAQAQAIGHALSTMIEATAAELVSSPIGRASRTAEIIRDRLGRASTLRFDDRLREICLGSWEGLDRTELAERAPGIFDGDGHYEWYFGTPDGETYEDFSARVADWLGSIDDKPIIVVTHGIVSRVLRGIYAGLSRMEALRLPVQQNKIFRLEGGSIEELEIEPVRPANQ